ncbi:MAG: galactokinase [Pseudonocardiaceae bacterium]
MSTQDVLAAAFRTTFGREPAGVWVAQGRVNLIGEHVDYAAGLCLPFALPQHTAVAAAARDDNRLRLRSWHPGAPPWDGRLDDVAPGNPAGWAGYPAGVLWALHSAGHPVPGLDLLVGDSVSPGAGLGSSAALECAVALALDSLAGLGLAGSERGRDVLAAVCRRAENEIVGAATGGMDQIASLRAVAGHALLLDCRDGTVRQVPLELSAAGLTLLVIDTRAPHRLVEGQYAARRRSAEQAAAALSLPSLREARVRDPDRLADPVLRRRARHVVSEIDRVREVVALLDAGRIREIGPALDASHISLRDDFEVSSPELDCAVDASRTSGALGARMTGGGFGGSALTLVEQASTAVVTDAVRVAAARHGHPRPVVHECL